MRGIADGVASLIRLTERPNGTDSADRLASKLIIGLLSDGGKAHNASVTQNRAIVARPGTPIGGQ